MASSVRGSGLVVVPLPPPLRLALSPRRRRRRAPGVRVAPEGGGAPRPPEPVEVVGVGSRKDAVIEFCLGSRTLSSTPIRFWTVHADNSEVQFIQRSHHTETIVRDLEPPLSLHSCPPAVIIVASAGQEADQIAALELLSATKSADNLAASIFLKPFCFEGQRRQVEEMAKKCYVVYIGRVPGVYEEWKDCAKQVNNFSGNLYQGYASREVAEEKWRKWTGHGRKKKWRSFIVIITALLLGTLVGYVLYSLS